MMILLSQETGAKAGVTRPGWKSPRRVSRGPHGGVRMPLHVLPERMAGAAENMAVDFLLLRRYPQTGHARFRAYGWHRPAFTFGYSQKIAAVRAVLPEAEGPFELCRRATGGGLVDHRQDWTYALVLPRGHPVGEARAVESYRLVHASLARALARAGHAVELKENCEPDACATDAPGICFRRAERFDVIHRETGAKVAGAAQKRTKEGLLLQGSVWRPALGAVDTGRLTEDFAAELAALLGLDATPCGWPDFDDDEVAALTEQYGSAEWNEQR